MKENNKPTPKTKRSDFKNPPSRNGNPVPSIDINKLEIYMRKKLKNNFPFEEGVNNIIRNSIPHIKTYLQNGVETDKEQPN